MPGLSRPETFDEVGQIVVELADIGDVAVGGAAAAMAAQADRVDGGAGRLQRLGKLEHRDVGAGRAVHQHDGTIRPAGIEAIVERCAVARLEGLRLGQLGEVPLRDTGNRVAGGQHRRCGGCVEGDDGGEGADDDQQEQAGGDEDAAKHGATIGLGASAIHCPFANSPTHFTKRRLVGLRASARQSPDARILRAHTAHERAGGARSGRA